MMRRVLLSLAALLVARVGLAADSFGFEIERASSVVATAMRTDVSVLTSQVLGDVTGNGKVDLYDFAVLKSDFGRRTLPGIGYLPADIDLNGRIDLTDFGILKANFGRTAEIQIPEPSTFLLAVLAGSGLLAFRRRGIGTQG